MREKIEKHLGLILALIAITVMLSRYVSSPETEYNSIRLEQAVTELEEGGSVKLAEVTPFEWETLYLFGPETGKEEIEEIIGFSSNSVRGSVDEDAVQLLFVKGEKVTASECAAPEKIGFRIDAGGRDRIEAASEPECSVTKEEGIVVLTLTER